MAEEKYKKLWAVGVHAYCCHYVNRDLYTFWSAAEVYVWAKNKTRAWDVAWEYAQANIDPASCGFKDRKLRKTDLSRNADLVHRNQINQRMRERAIDAWD